MPVCSKPYNPDLVTERKKARGPTFTLGSIAVDGPAGTRTEVHFAHAKQAATRGILEIRQAADREAVERVYQSAREVLERALRRAKGGEKQSLEARLRNLNAARDEKLVKLRADENRAVVEAEWNALIDRLVQRTGVSDPHAVAKLRARLEAAVAAGVETVGDLPINIHLAGTVFPLDRVKDASLAHKYPRSVMYNDAGFPDFTPYAIATVKLDHLKESRAKDFDEADRLAGYGANERPEDYTWHHVEDRETLVLVPRDLHDAVHHTGGVAAQQNRDKLEQLLTQAFLSAISELHDQGSTD